MPPARVSSALPLPAERLVVRLQQVLLNGLDPTAELDGLVDLVVKAERELQPGSSWTNGIYTMQQFMTILCGNHTLVRLSFGVARLPLSLESLIVPLLPADLTRQLKESINLTSFSQGMTNDPLSWRIDRGFCRLTFHYPESLDGAELTDKVHPASTRTKCGSRTQQTAKTAQSLSTLDIIFPTYNAYAKTAGALEKLSLLRPLNPIGRPHSTSHTPASLVRTPSGQPLRPNSAQANASYLIQRPSSHPGKAGRTRSPHPSQRGGSIQTRRRVSVAPSSSAPPPRTAGNGNKMLATSMLAERAPFPGELLHNHLSLHTEDIAASPYFPSSQLSQTTASQASSQEQPRWSPKRAQRRGPIQLSNSVQTAPGTGNPPRRVVPGPPPPPTPPNVDGEATFPSGISFVPELDAVNPFGNDQASSGVEMLGELGLAEGVDADEGTRIVLSGIQLFDLFQKRCDTALQSSNAKTPESRNRILAQHSVEFGRAWERLCRESVP